jgi:hypothetical protein
MNRTNKLNTSDYIELNVDTIVEENENYRLKIESYYDSNLKKKLENLTKIYNSHDPPGNNDFCRDISSIYFQYRKEANIISNSLLLEYLMDPVSNVFYETTSSNAAFEWILKVSEITRNAGYQVHLIFIYANLNQLKKRALERALQKTSRLPCTINIESIFHQSNANLIRILDQYRVLFDSISIIDGISEDFIDFFARIENDNIEYGINSHEKDFRFLCQSSFLRTSDMCLRLRNFL